MDTHHRRRPSPLPTASRLLQDAKTPLIAILVLACLLRLYVLIFCMGPANADEAIIGLMTRHILQGERPLFYYGQFYYGPLDAYLNTLIFKVFGASSLTLRVLPFLASIAFIVAIDQLGNQLYSRSVGLLSALLAAIGPFFLTVRGLLGDAAYSLILLIGTVSFLLFLRMLRHPTLANIVGLGLLCAFGTWVFPLMGYYILAIVLAWFLAWARQHQNTGSKRLSRKTEILLLLVSLAVCLVVLILRDSSFLFFGRLLNFVLLFSNSALPILFGFAPLTIGHPTTAISCSAIVSLGIIAIALFFGLQRFRQGNGLLFVFFVTSSMLYFLFFNLMAITETTLINPRYLFPLYTAIPLFADALLQFSKQKAWLRTGLVVLIVGSNLFNNLSSAAVQQAAIEPPRLLEWLSAQAGSGQEKLFVYTDYSTGYPLAFESQEKIIPFITEQNQPGNNRYRPYLQQVSGAQEPLYIYPTGSENDAAFRHLLQEQAVDYQEDHVDAYSVYSGLTHPIRFSSGETE